MRPNHHLAGPVRLGQLLASVAPGLCSTARATLSSNQTDFVPVGLSLGDELSANTSSGAPFTLNASAPIATLDYGQERAGYPFFSVAALSQPVQIEVKYSEPYSGLAEPWSDGPYTFAVGLSNSFRVETFNVTSPGRLTAALIQGGQRWQSIELISEGSISFDQVGFEATVDATEVEQYPGQFDCDDELLNAIWRLGAVAASTACVEKGSQPAIWDVDPEKGVLVQSQRPAQTLAGSSFENYTLTFDTMIVRGGVWWAVAFPFGRGSGLHLQLVSELPSGSTFANVNTTLTPPNSILLSYGHDFVNQTTLSSYYLDTFPVPFNVSENAWYQLTTALSPDGELSVSLNGESIFTVSIADYYTAATVTFSGSFGFGAYQDQAAYVRNVTVTDSVNGTAIYTNPMTSSDVLAEYGTQSNLASVCLDGPKRDRLVWLGDFYHTARIIGASTSRFDLTKGTLEFLHASQLEDGEMNISPPMGYDPTDNGPFASGGIFGLSDYQLLGIDGVYSYVQQTNDLDFLTETWAGWQLLANWTISTINSTDGLVHVPSAFLGASSAGSAVSCLAVQALRQLSELAEVAGDNSTQARCAAAADALADAVNSQLWNDDLGVYALSTSDTTDFSVAGIAFCLRSGVADDDRAARAVAALDTLALAPGYKDSTATSSNDSTVVISPNTNGFLLDALLSGSPWSKSTSTSTSSAAAATAGAALLRSLWGAMTEAQAPDHAASGASWEYVAQDGTPGLGLFTSLAHPWGGAATYVLPAAAAGLRPAAGPAGFGWARWELAPGGPAGVDGLGALGLARASASVATPGGGRIAVTWRWAGNATFEVEVDAPADTEGVFRLGNETRALSGESRYSFSTVVPGAP